MAADALGPNRYLNGLAQRVGALGVALVAGIVLAPILVDGRGVPDRGREILVRAECTTPTRLYLFSRSHEAVDWIEMFEPGTYRFAPVASRLPTDVIEVGTERATRRRLQDLPLSDRGELLLPTEWCRRQSGLATVGLLGSP